VLNLTLLVASSLHALDMRYMTVVVETKTAVLFGDKFLVI
jgi:hypothetical protein